LRKKKLRITSEPFLQQTKDARLNKKQEEKVQSLEATWAKILENAKKHILEGDNRVLTLPDIQLILGTATLMFEEEVYKEMIADNNKSASSKQSVPQQLKETAKEYENKNVVSNDAVKAEAEFEKDSNVNNKNRIYH
jgi:hypothetical protein